MNYLEKGPEGRPTSYEDMTNDLMKEGLTEPFTPDDVDDFVKGVDSLEVGKENLSKQAPDKEGDKGKPVFQKPTEKLSQADLDKIMEDGDMEKAA